MVQRYRGRISGPLLDRIDMHVEVPAVAIHQLQAAPTGTSTAEASTRVTAARQRQSERQTGGANSQLGARQIGEHCALDAAGQKLLEAAFDRLGLSARALHRIQRVARTIADLRGEGDLQSVHLAEAIQYRTLDRRMSE